MNNTKLAELITDRFMPFAFKCNCEGNHADCAEVLSDRAVWAQRETVERIAEYITKLGETT